MIYEYHSDIICIDLFLYNIATNQTRLWNLRRVRFVHLSGNVALQVWSKQFKARLVICYIFGSILFCFAHKLVSLNYNTLKITVLVCGKCKIKVLLRPEESFVGEFKVEKCSEPNLQ